MNDSTTVQLSVGEVRSIQFSPSIVTFRNAGVGRAATSTSAPTFPTAWMATDTTTRDDTTTGLATIEGIDMDAEVPCSGVMCKIEDAHPADYIVRASCPHGIEVDNWCERAWAERRHAACEQWAHKVVHLTLEIVIVEVLR